MSTLNRIPRARWTVSAASVGVGAALAALPAHASAQQADHPCSDWADSVVVDAFDRTWVGGSAADNRVLEWPTGHAHYGDFAIARLKADGSPDPRFGDGGSVIVDVGDFESAADIAQTWDGIVAAGTTAFREGDQRGPNDLVIIKLNERGQPVRDFGDDGVLQLDLGGNEQLAGVAAGWLGEVYVAGTLVAHGAREGFVLRLRADGRLDRSYGSRGVVKLGAVMHEALGIRLVPSGLLVGGMHSANDAAHAVVARLDGRGRLDKRFGIGGTSSTAVGGAASGGHAFFSLTGASAVSLSVMTDSGDSQVATFVFDRRGVARPGGVQLVDAPGGVQDSPSAGAFFWGESLYVVGATYPEDFGSGDAFAARTSLAGLLDPSFGGGLVTEHFDLEYAAFNDLAIRPTTLTAVGWNIGEEPDTLPPSDALVIRYRHDGRRDASFGDDGVVLLDFMNGALACGPRVEE